MMRFQILLVFFITARIGSSYSEPTKVSFPPKLLKTDLDSIMRYYEKSGKTIPAYIHWPKSITFSVRLVATPSTEKYLKVEGEFRRKKSRASFDGLYYKDGIFYAEETKGASMNIISKLETVDYKQPSIVEDKPYLSIRYFDFEELQQEISEFYNANKLHFENVLYDYPATFLATLPNPEGIFLEYFFWCKEEFPAVTDGLLRVLIGKEQNNKVQLTDSDVRSRLVFDQRKNTLTIPEELNINSKPLQNVFGVRMNIRAYVAEVPERGNAIKLFDAYDLYYGNSLPSRQFIGSEDLLEKVKNVEPRLAYGDIKFSKLELPKRVKFQVKGSILAKSINYDSNGEIYEECPFLIEYDRHEQYFMFKGRIVQRLCTDDKELWAE